MSSVSPSSSASQQSCASLVEVGLRPVPPVRPSEIMDTTGLTPEQSWALVKAYYEALSVFNTVCLAGLGGAASVVGGSSGVESCESSLVSASTTSSRKRPGRKKRERDRRSVKLDAIQGDGIVLNRRGVCTPGSNGFCYLRLVEKKFWQSASMALGESPTILQLLDSPTIWFDYSVVDELKLDCDSGGLCHLQELSGLPVRGALSVLAAECHPVSGTLGAIASCWKKGFVGSITYESRIGGSNVRVEKVGLVVGGSVGSVDIVVDQVHVSASHKCDVFVPVGREVLVVSNVWFEADGLSYEPVVMDYGATRAVYIKEPGHYSLLLKALQPDAEFFQFTFGVQQEVVAYPLPVVLAGALGLYVGMLEQATPSMLLDLYHNKSRIPKVSLQFGLERFKAYQFDPDVYLPLPFVDKCAWLARGFSGPSTLREIATLYSVEAKSYTHVAWTLDDWGFFRVGLHAAADDVSSVLERVREAMLASCSDVEIMYGGKTVSMEIDKVVLLVD